MTRGSVGVLLSFVAVAVLWCTMGRAQEEPLYSQSLRDCHSNPANYSTAGMIDCWNAERERLDTRLNLAYRELVAHTRPEAQMGLRLSQEQWQQYRDVNCDAWAAISGGSIDRINSAACLARLTAQRVAEITDMRRY